MNTLSTHPPPRPRLHRAAFAFEATLLAIALLCAATAAAAQNAPPGASATTGSSVTRQQNKTELRQLERNGYQPGSDDPHYPDNIRSAEQKAHGASSPAGTTGTTGGNGAAQ